MGFENDYRVFIKAIVSKDISIVENMLSQSDNRRVFISKAIDDLGKDRVQELVNLFKSIGLKRTLEKIFEDCSNHDSIKDYIIEDDSNKIVCVHDTNKRKNEKYHLSGSSFSRKRRDEIPA